MQLLQDKVAMVRCKACALVPLIKKSFKPLLGKSHERTHFVVYSTFCSRYEADACLCCASFCVWLASMFVFLSSVSSFDVLLRFLAAGSPELRPDLKAARIVLLLNTMPVSMSACGWTIRSSTDWQAYLVLISPCMANTALPLFV